MENKIVQLVADSGNLYAVDQNGGAWWLSEKGWIALPNLPTFSEMVASKLAAYEEERDRQLNSQDR